MNIFPVSCVYMQKRVAGSVPPSRFLQAKQMFFMDQKQMYDFLTEIHNAKRDEKIISEIIQIYHERYHSAYIFHDAIAKEIFAVEENLDMMADLVNACLNLSGPDCISNPHLENPVVSGGLLYKGIEQDILLTHKRLNANGDEIPGDRIGIEFQHKGGDFFCNRLLFYVARHVGHMLAKGDFYDKMERLNLISFQFFDYLPWEVSKNYRHTIRYRDEELHTFSKQQTITVIEVSKFLSHANEYASDNSRLAQWLRAINAVNRNADFSKIKGDGMFARLQKWADLSRFSKDFFINAGEHMKDDVEIEAYLARQEGRKEGRMEGREEGRAEGREEGRMQGRRESADIITNLQAKCDSLLAEIAALKAALAARQA